MPDRPRRASCPADRPPLRDRAVRLWLDDRRLRTASPYPPSARQVREQAAARPRGASTRSMARPSRYCRARSVSLAAAVTIGLGSSFTQWRGARVGRLAPHRRRVLDGAYIRGVGADRLHDLGAAERVLQFGDGAGDVNFGPLRPLGVFGHNLPTRPTSLIGREADTAAVLAALGDSRLVTLIGTGGVGKSRLALQVAAESVDHFDGGVWWVELATVADPSALPGAVLDALGLPAAAGSTAGPGGCRPRRRPADVASARQLRARDRPGGVVRRRGAQHVASRDCLGDQSRAVVGPW